MFFSVIPRATVSYDSQDVVTFDMTANIAPSAAIPEGPSLSAHLLPVIHARSVTSYPVDRLYDAARDVKIYKVISYPHIILHSIIVDSAVPDKLK